MPDLSLVLALLAGLCVAWLAATWVVALGAVWLGEWLERRHTLVGQHWLPAEAWMALASSGAAAGGFVAYTTAASWRLGEAGWPGALAPLVVLAWLGMLAGGGFACACAAGYLWGASD